MRYRRASRKRSPHAEKRLPSGIKAGVIRNEVTAPSVSLHTKLSTAICGAMGVPSDLVLGSSSESGSRESFRRLASTTINNILTTVSREWEFKMGTALEWDLDRLRSSDEVSRAARSAVGRMRSRGSLIRASHFLKRWRSRVSTDADRSPSAHNRFLGFDENRVENPPNGSRA